MRKMPLGILGAMVALSLVIGVSATFSDYNADRSVHWNITTDDTELIDLKPIQPYAYIADNGELVVDFSPENPNYPGYGDGISPASEYNFDEVFAVSNHLWEDMWIVVRVTSSDTHVEFYSHEVEFMRWMAVLQQQHQTVREMMFALLLDQTRKRELEWTSALTVTVREMCGMRR